MMIRKEVILLENRVVSIKNVDSETKSRAFSEYTRKIKETEVLIKAARINSRRVDEIYRINRYGMKKRAKVLMILKDRMKMY